MEWGVLLNECFMDIDGKRVVYGMVIIIDGKFLVLVDGVVFGGLRGCDVLYVYFG